MIPLFKVYNEKDVGDRVLQTLHSGYVGQGERVDEFEAKLQAFTGAPILTTCSGTAALDLALHLCGVGPGDEVLTTPQTCTATNGVIVRRGATPVFCDIDPLTGNLSVADCGRNMNAKVKAIMAVDWGGRACDYPALRSLGVPVIEDAAHAIGTTIDDDLHVARGGGDFVAFSFQAIKHLNTGDGGGLKVPGHQLERARLLRWYGLDRRGKASFRCEQDITEVGYKYHMNDIAASIGIANLASLPTILEKHRANARRLCQELASTKVTRPAWDPQSSWWIYTIMVDDVPDFIARMKERGIDTSPVHARNDRHTAFRAASRSSSDLSGVDQFSRHQVAIPVGWWLSPADITRIVEAVDVCSRPA